VRLGRYQLRRVHGRFWFFAAGALGLIIAAFFFWPKSPSPDQTWTSGEQTAFSEQGLPPTELLADPSYKKEDLFSDKSLANCNEDNPRCIYSVQDTGTLIGYLNPNSLGVPFRFRAYLPSPDAVPDGGEISLSSERRSLYSENFSDGGWSFRPGILTDFLPLQDAVADDGLEPGALNTEAAGAFSLIDDGVISPGALLLGFQGGIPSSGAIYDFDAMLFSSSNAIQTPGDPVYAADPIPTFLVKDFRQVGGEEVFQPASEIAELDISYSAGGIYQLTLHDFEWPADGRARMCVTLANRASRAAPVWSGLYEGIKTRIGGVNLLGVPAPGSAFEVGTATEEMQIGESLSGYLIFGLEQDDPTIGNVSGSPSEQEVRISIASLLGEGRGGSLDNKEVFVNLSGGPGRAIPFQQVRRSPEDWVPPLVRGETCSE
jgi:hypothetical protein